MKTHKDMERILISKEEIDKRVTELGKEISDDYRYKSTPLLICILKGAVMFFADLVRAIDIDVNIEFMAISSYGARTKTSGEVRLLKDLDTSVAGRNIIIVEDIVDSGVSLDYIMRMLRTRGAESVRICTLLSKPARRRIHIPIDYLGFEIPNEFIIGYGLDLDEKYRNLVDIGVYRQSEKSDEE